MFIFENIFREASKARFINQLDISDDEKEKWISFFDSPIGQQYSHKINWQNKDDVTIENFEKVKELADNSNTKNKKKAYQDLISKDRKSLFDGRKGFDLVYENNDWLFYTVDDYEAAVFCDSVECGGQGAKWCIGTKDSNEYWYRYQNGGDRFILAIRKGNAEPDDLKYMIQVTNWEDGPPDEENYEDDEGNIDYSGMYLNDMAAATYHIWNQPDENEDDDDSLTLSKFGITERNVKEWLGVSYIEKPTVIKSSSQLAQNDKVILNPLFGCGIEGIIYQFAFNKLKGIDTVEIVEGVERLEHDAFHNGSFLYVKFPKSLREVHAKAFSGCKNILNIDTSENPNFIFEDGVLYNKNKTAIKLVTENAKFVMPDTVTVIEDFVFNRSHKDSLFISENLAHIGHSAFSYLYELTSIDLPKTLKFIDNYAFSHSMLTINYAGSKSDWEKITKMPDWNKYAALTIKCTDGIIESIQRYSDSDIFL